MKQGKQLYVFINQSAKHILFLIGLFFATTSFAQTQQGYVKTKGRMIDGKHVPGQGLTGAIVSIQDRTSVVVESDDGSFSFPIPAKTFMVKSVQKNGYELVDPDVVRMPYNYSDNPIYLVMEIPEQQKQDQLDSERKIRRTLQRRLQQREDELEALKEANRITLEEYQQALQKLYADQQNNEQLISDMAKEYAQLDYDQMDELNQRISDAIINGHLTEADSLLRSKGNMKNRVAEIRKEQQAEAQREEEIAQEQEDLAEAKAGTQKKLEDVASDCYKFFDRFKLSLDWDSAAYYIRYRAELDTSNVLWQLSAALFFHEQSNLQEAEFYYLRCLKTAREQNDDLGVNIYISDILNNLAIIYLDTERLNESEFFFREAMEKRRQLSKINPLRYEIDVARSLNGLADLYARCNREIESEALYQEALTILKQSLASGTEEYQSCIASTLIGLADVYQLINLGENFEDREILYLEALEIYRKLAQTGSLIYEHLLANCLTTLALNYFLEGANCEDLFLEALSIQRRLVQANSQAYEDDLAVTMAYLAMFYKDNKRFAESEALYLEVLGIERRLALIEPRLFEKNLVKNLRQLESLYEATNRLSDSEILLLEVLEIYKRWENERPNKDSSNDTPMIATMRDLADIYFKMERYEKCEAIRLEVLEAYKKWVEEDPQNHSPLIVAIELASLGDLYYQIKRFPECESMYLEAIELYKQISYETRNKTMLYRLAEMYRLNKRFEESEKMYLEALAIQKDLLKTNSSEYDPKMTGALCYGLAMLYSDNKHLEESEAMYLEAIKNFRAATATNPSELEPHLVQMLISLGQFYYNSNRFEESETIYLEVMEIQKRLVKVKPNVYEQDLANTLISLGHLKIQRHQLPEAPPYFEEAVKLYREIVDTYPSQQYWYEYSLYNLGSLYYHFNEYKNSYNTYEELIPMTRVRYQNDIENQKSSFVKILDEQSFSSIIVGQYEKSEQYAREALSIDTLQYRINSSLAASLLFQGKCMEAEQVYTQYKEKLKDKFLMDFRYFEDAGVIPDERKADVEKIRKLLSE